jgi:serine protease Do
MYLGLDEEHRGSAIVFVQPGSLVDKVGLKIYDVVTEIDNQKVKNSQDLSDIISDKDPTAKIKLKILRNNKGQAVEKILTVALIERPDEKTLLKNIPKRSNR